MSPPPDAHDLDARLQAVHALWSAYRERGEGAIELLHPEVELVDSLGNAFHGHDGVRAFFAQFRERGEVFIASPFTFEPHEPDVLVVGHRRIRSRETVRGEYLYFVHSVRDGRVSRIAAFTTRERALEDVERRAS
jgi:hypothetical protein